ncbi:MAG: YebC/PmpR family DNA-binding transcriptional regulator [Eubacteriaceae bacterium]|jgi:YebC/PmpR family DNA-binding regulatory protein|nr:YebC/PmpR family DNA-binding transcriptional regulator [Eubacteriaceae bacterium]
MAGHSKWANIKHKKERQDSKKGKIFTKHARAIAVAAKEGGSDPEMNAKLKDAILKAKMENMPNDNIDRAIKKGSGEMQGQNFEEITYEGYGPGGAAVIVFTLTDNKNRTAADVRYIFDKNKGNLGTSGCVSYLFAKKGQIFISSEATDEDTLFTVALENGAEDILSSEEGYEILTKEADFASVYNAFTENSIAVLEAQVAMIPSSETLIEGENVQRFEKMLDMFSENDDVQEIWHNGIYEEEQENNGSE